MLISSCFVVVVVWVRLYFYQRVFVKQEKERIKNPSKHLNISLSPPPALSSMKRLYIRHLLILRAVSRNWNIPPIPSPSVLNTQDPRRDSSFSLYWWVCVYIYIYTVWESHIHLLMLMLCFCLSLKFFLHSVFVVARCIFIAIDFWGFQIDFLRLLFCF